MFTGRFESNSEVFFFSVSLLSTGSEAMHDVKLHCDCFTNPRAGLAAQRRHFQTNSRFQVQGFVRLWQHAAVFTDDDVSFRLFSSRLHEDLWWNSPPFLTFSDPFVCTLNASRTRSQHSRLPPGKAEGSLFEGRIFESLLLLLFFPSQKQINERHPGGHQDSAAADLRRAAEAPRQAEGG